MTKSPFETASRQALQDILSAKMQSSKYGYFISEEEFEEVLDDLLEFFKLSRDLRSRPEKILSAASPQRPPRS